MIQVKVVRVHGKDRMAGALKMQKSIEKRTNDGWELKHYAEAGRFGGYYSAVFTRDTSELRSKEPEQ